MSSSQMAPTPVTTSNCLESARRRWCPRPPELFSQAKGGRVRHGDVTRNRMNKRSNAIFLRGTPDDQANHTALAGEAFGSRRDRLGRTLLAPLLRASVADARLTPRPIICPRYTRASAFKLPRTLKEAKSRFAVVEITCCLDPPVDSEVMGRLTSTQILTVLRRDHEPQA